jgi:hypothetical protein
MIKSEGSLLGFVDRPIAAGLAILTVAVWLTPLAVAAWRRRQGPGEGERRSVP